jgi:predicted transcriptional regulator
MSLLEIIDSVTRRISPGPAPSFNEAHVIKALEVIGTNESIGRIRLSKELDLGEGTIRTLLKHLKREGLIESSRTGIVLSEQGKELFFEMRNKLSPSIEIPDCILTVASSNIGILVRDSAEVVGSGMEQRDTAIKSGATGATTLIFSENKLYLPMGEKNLSESMPELHDKLINTFKPKENDVIIVGCGENSKIAEIGAKMAAIRLLRSKN